MTSLLVLALLLGAPVLGLSTLFFRQRLRKAEARETGPTVRGRFGLLAGAALFTFFGPLAFLVTPIPAVLVGGAFLLRSVTLLPARGRLERKRLTLLAGISLY